jgi:hypothetical protein
LILISQADAALRYRSLFLSRKAAAAVLLSRGDSVTIERKVQVSTRIFIASLAAESLQNVIRQGLEE